MFLSYGEKWGVTGLPKAQMFFPTIFLEDIIMLKHMLSLNVDNSPPDLFRGISRKILGFFSSMDNDTRADVMGLSSNHNWPSAMGEKHPFPHRENIEEIGALQ